MTSEFEFKKLLNKIERQEISVPENLVKNVILRVDENRQKTQKQTQKQKVRKEAKFKIFGLSLVSISSLLISIPIISQIITSFTESGFNSYLSIIFSDSDVAITYWKEIVISLAESLPAVGIISLLIVALVFVWSTLKATSAVRNSLITA